MENNALIIVTAFIEAVKVFDFEKVATLLHPKIRWEQPGDNRFSGVKNSIEEVFGMCGGMFEVSEKTLALAEVKSYAVNGNEVAVCLVWKAKKGNEQLDVINVDVYTVEEGKITAAKVFTADEQQENTFWGN
ncbi:hypothetical protein SAMN05444266_11221 [Chitinophaga jiangningensis]|uniref:SnoaL-like domain-containing protein n=1 Tax=Chitinophaga jiangningensis TaxID=1419482 RepID=A0A1M7M1Q2_9BACT|nr:nuclear transport factor 2 family protein [Chitinophaga jiangningensis]SHM84564.1 hypothetical protein SAMN05444266_11221 [Chitinophaga jiangningensis]